MTRQLLGHSAAAAYTHVLSHGARCVEIDVWPSAQGPIVTHGHTFSKSVPFLDVCSAIGSRVAANDWPLLVSLECHVGVEGQPESDRSHGPNVGRQTRQASFARDDSGGVSPQELKGKILLMVRMVASVGFVRLSLRDPGGILPHSGARRRTLGCVLRLFHRFRIIA
jgi:phosphatidylinositol phospholipase C delta